MFQYMSMTARRICAQESASLRTPPYLCRLLQRLSAIGNPGCWFHRRSKRSSDPQRVPPADLRMFVGLIVTRIQDGLGQRTVERFESEAAALGKGTHGFSTCSRLSVSVVSPSILPSGSRASQVQRHRRRRFRSSLVSPRKASLVSTPSSPSTLGVRALIVAFQMNPCK
ncbi:hypothetical protein A4X13_0g8722 [Tilletia indica]|uniref:Uncharacterized protein n=1 Tax=Tilletia indica TaxID=43049 RepID=A0A8T8SDZ8_9BASI|nr:hypothetical protein A4X13_0g8722 [Tilletia indica]